MGVLRLTAKKKVDHTNLNGQCHDNKIPNEEKRFQSTSEEKSLAQWSDESSILFLSVLLHSFSFEMASKFTQKIS